MKRTSHHCLLAFAVALSIPSSSALAAEPDASRDQLLRCGSFSVRIGHAVSVPKDLQTALCNYYDAENASDWKTTYRMRPQAAREIVSRAVYEEEMARSKHSLGIVDMIVNSARTVGDRLL